MCSRIFKKSAILWKNLHLFCSKMVDFLWEKNPSFKGILFLLICTFFLIKIGALVPYLYSFFIDMLFYKKNIMPFFSIMEKWNWTIIGFIYQLNEGNMANANYYCTTTKGCIPKLISSYFLPTFEVHPRLDLVKYSI